MQPIYVSKNAAQTINDIKDMSHYERVAAKLQDQEGYYFRDNLDLQSVPDNRYVLLSVNVTFVDYWKDNVTFPSELQGIVFSKAPNLPPKYEEIIRYWGNVEELYKTDTGAVYFQNSDNEYFVNLTEVEEVEEVLGLTKEAISSAGGT